MRTVCFWMWLCRRLFFIAIIDGKGVCVWKYYLKKEVTDIKQHLLWYGYMAAAMLVVSVWLLSWNESNTCYRCEGLKD